MAQRFHWTLDVIDALALDDAYEVIDVALSIDKAHADDAAKARMLADAARR